jgi:hypothetical protein
MIRVALEAITEFPAGSHDLRIVFSFLISQRLNACGVIERVTLCVI